MFCIMAMKSCLFTFCYFSPSLISFVEFRSFESLLWQPDAVNQMAFQLFDQEHAGRVSFGEIEKFCSTCTICIL